MKNTKKTFKDKLVDFRIKNNLTQLQLSELCGLPIVTISRLENGHVEPSVKTLHKLNKILDQD